MAAPYAEALPTELKYGQPLRFLICSSALNEVEARTSAGPITFKWDN